MRLFQWESARPSPPGSPVLLHRPGNLAKDRRYDMKFKPTHKLGGVMVELGPRETQLPSQPAPEPAGVLPAFQLRKILVPLDFSACSAKSLDYAIPFTRQFKAELLLLHVVASHPLVPELGPVDVVSMEAATRELENLQARTELPFETVSSLLRTGEPFVEIINVANEGEIDLVILSTHGRTGFARVLMGSTAEKVVRHASCPVLVVRPDQHEFVSPVSTGLGYDGSVI
jgi:nucleotide-binding universal stress UspA family protein